jgi:cytochrome d ubiquinol oxidase subunit I
MDTELLSRLQFGTTTVYHFFFVPVSIGLAGLVAGIQTAWVRTGDPRYLRLTRFFGKLLLINFAVGVGTGLVQEFQFGMNWSQFSRFVGDIFGAPLALEGLLAFFLESTFLGLWIFGWDKLGKKVHLACIWVVAVATVISAYFILAANSFMQNPVGYRINDQLGRAELTDFGAVLSNPVLLVTMPHQIFACYMVGSSILIAAAAWHLVRQARKDRAAEAKIVATGGSATDYVRDDREEQNRSSFRTALKIGTVALLISGAGTIVAGDLQSKVMTEVQPMKMAAAEGLYETERPAAFSVFTIGTLDGKHEIWSIKIPRLLSFLAHGNLTGEVEGINDLQREYAEKYGPGEYAPVIPTTYWTFRIMVGLGVAAVGASLLIAWFSRKGRDPATTGMLGLAWRFGPLVLPFLPLLGNSFGWIFTETGRQPWLVYGLLPTSSGVSTNLTPALVVTSLIVFTLIYGVLAVIEFRLFTATIGEGLPEVDADTSEQDAEDRPLSYAF